MKGQVFGLVNGTNSRDVGWRVGRQEEESLSGNYLAFTVFVSLPSLYLIFLLI